MTQEKLNKKLLDAAEWDDMAGVKEAISLGADVNTADENSWTALMTACWRGNTNIVKLLIEYGADINIKKENGKTALDILREYCPDKYKQWIEETVIKPKREKLQKEDLINDSEQDILPDWDI